jgi:anti-sigma factor RsiW
MNSSDLESKILQMLDGELPADGVEALEAELLQNAESRETYRKLVRLHSSLEIRHESLATIANTKVDRISPRQRIVNLALGAAAAIALVSVIVLSLKKGPDSSKGPDLPIASFRTSPGSLFTLTHEVADREETREGQELAVGSRLLLQRGTVEGAFQSGVRVVVEAPCDLQLLAEDRVALG